MDMIVTSKVLRMPSGRKNMMSRYGCGLVIKSTASMMIAPKKEIRHAENVDFSPLPGNQSTVSDFDAGITSVAGVAAGGSRRCRRDPVLPPRLG